MYGKRFILQNITSYLIYYSWYSIRELKSVTPPPQKKTLYAVILNIF